MYILRSIVLICGWLAPLLGLTTVAIVNHDINYFTMPTPYQVCFSPSQHCEFLLTQKINQAKQKILVALYSFTAKRIAKALIAAKQRGVKVLVIADKSNLDPHHFSRLSLLNKANIPIWIDNQVTIAHNKVMIIDNYWLETGSYNYTNAANYKNAENMLLIGNKQLANVYSNNWYHEQQRSKKLS